MLRSFLALLVTALAFSACKAVPADRFAAEEEKPKSAEVAVSSDPAGASAFSAYTAVMTPRERHHFVRQKEAEHQWRFIRANGIDIRREMQDRLAPGMGRTSVAAALSELEAVPMQRNDANVLHYRVYNGTSSTYMNCRFDDAGLVSWSSYTDREIAHQRSLEEGADEIRERLDAVLRPGMGKNELTRSATKAKQFAAEYRALMKDQLERDRGEDTYGGTHAPSDEADYHLAAQLMRAEAMVEAYEVLDREADYVRNEGFAEYWYHIVPSVEDDERYLVIEYRFDRSRLLSWHVYATDFLGFGEWKHQ